MWFLTFLILGIFGTTMSAVAFGAEELTCESDNDCPVNTFCYEISNLCSPCKPNYCSRLNRANSSWRKCHKEARECGACLEGYYEEILTDGTAREACILAPVSKKHGTQLPSVMSTKNQSFSPYLIYIGIAAVFGIIGVAGMEMHSRRRRYYHDFLQPVSNPREDNATPPHQQRRVPSRQFLEYHLPPSYTPAYSLPQLTSGNTQKADPQNQSDQGLNRSGQVEEYPLSLSPSAPLLSATKDEDDSPLHKSCEETSFSTPTEIPVSAAYTTEGLVVCEKACLLQAKPFRNPSYENISSSGSEDSISASEESQEENSDYENMNLHDEATIPCTWTPASTSVTEVPTNNDEICNTSNLQGETTAKRLSSNTEGQDGQPNNGSERKRMKTDEGNQEQAVELEERPFRCFSQNRNLSDHEQQQQDHSD